MKNEDLTPMFFYAVHYFAFPGPYFIAGTGKIGMSCSVSAGAAGVHGKPFTMYKFWTLTHERDENRGLLSDEEGFTPLGSFRGM